MNFLKQFCGVVTATMAIGLPAVAQTAEDFQPYKESALRLPSVPLLVNDPYFSIWSNYDNLNGGNTTLWCEKEKAVDGILRVDGTPYRFMGGEKKCLLSPIAGMTADGTEWQGRVSHTTQSGTGWTSSQFNDSSWSLEDAAWGTTPEYPNVKNVWSDENSDIYVRRTVTLTADDLEKDLWVQFSHDDVFELYINGTRIVSTGETWVQGEQAQLTDTQKTKLKVGENVIAAHCHNTTGGAYIDFGLYKNLFETNTEVLKATQNSVNVMATSSYYNFTCGPVNLDVVFTAPMLIDDLDLISTPINYISYQVKSTDGQKHSVQFYVSTSAQLTVNEMSQPTISTTTTENGIKYLKAGSEEQPILGRSGDAIAIDWGYLYIPAINGNVTVASNLSTEAYFTANGSLPACATSPMRSTNTSTMPALAFCNDLGTVDEARSFMLIGYDEVYDIQYMKQNYKAYYARNGKTIFQAFEEFRDNYSSIMSRCRALDKTIYDDGLAAGNVKYAEQLAGNYRLVMAAHKLFQDNTGKALYFSKENKSNGCVNTVDLTYPESPLYLTYNPELQKGMILSILDYALTDERKGKNCAAHDLGTYPLANGQVYGDSMPLEESANILILANAICRITGDGEWLKPYKSVLKTWANYCKSEGQNPGNQLCTDDFKGASEQNTNLSVKAILAVAAYTELATYIGDTARDASKFIDYAKNMALIWEADARDGDHYRMEFHKSNTWSQKYNLVWDFLWGYHIFPSQVRDREINYYLTQQKAYGLPLDCRDLQTKSDWIMWTASMAPDTETFLKFSDLHYKYINETTSRIPLSDWYMSNSGSSVGFSARSVIGGLWMKVFADKITPKVDESEVAEWEPKGNHIKTRWADDVTPDNTLPEYPRPLLQREDWMNLNGLWDYAITAQSGSAPTEYDGKILVPFPIESSLSGVNKPLEPSKALWYKREISIPQEWIGKTIMLNFGAVDYQATVYLNGTSGRNQVANHIGGNNAFSVDITKKLSDEGTATLYVKVIDNTDEGAQPTGKQRRYPGANGDIFYTSSSGIWQTVWLEPVESTSISDIRTTSDIDAKTLTFDVTLKGTPTGTVKVSVMDGDKEIATKSAAAAATTSLTVDVPSAKLWSPTHPNLYDVNITLVDGETTLDNVNSYAALRKISYKKSDDGYWRLQLNNEDLFQIGLLDQGYWPDGLLTAPTDEALAYDLEKTKDWGFNMVRKHMKVEPARWFYHCDRLGLLVWQDMPAQFRSDESWITDAWATEHDCNQNGTVETNYRSEWTDIINQHYSNPCVVVWTPFNEGWGQFKTADIVAFTQGLDNTRLVNPASGGSHYKLGEGTFVDQHNYGQPMTINENVVDATRPLVLGEYGGLGRNISNHRWLERNTQTYNTYTSENLITLAFESLADNIYDLANGYVTADGAKVSYAAAVYTQTTDVETEVNGVMTYDRETVKFNEPRLKTAVEKLAGLYGAETSINVPNADNADGQCTYYNIMGMRLAGPQPGFNIVKKADGSAQKIFRTTPL